jgi:Mycotoxin biosynthesis protein UstYa
MNIRTQATKQGTASDFISDPHVQYKPLEEEDTPKRPPQRCPVVVLISAIVLFILALFTPAPFTVVCSSLSCVESEYEFQRTHNYTDISPAGNQVWEDLNPPNGGFLMRKINGTKHRYDIAMFHQLHCLHKLRLSYSGIYNTSLGFEPSHVMHCLDYLRQVSRRYIASFRLASIRASSAMPTVRLRSGDFGEPNGKRVEHVDEYVKHMCRSSESLYRKSRESGNGEDGGDT